MSDKPHPMLLPNGLLDLLPPEAEAESRAINLFMETFAAFGYERVKPPLVEFEESLLGGDVGQPLARQTFRMMDPVSRRMMGVRADVTAQIARIATSRMIDVPRPLRLSYAADVLRVNGTQLRPERQFCQVGCEMVGVESLMADVETPLVALKALAAAGIKKLSVDLTVPTLIAHLYDETGTGEEERARLDDLIEKRDRDAILAEKSPAASVIAQLLEHHGSFEKISLPAKAAADGRKLLDVAGELRRALDVYGLNDIRITIDPLERRGFEYQTGVSFTLFSVHAQGELGRGGRYSLGSETATGFTLYMDTVLRVASTPSPPKRQSVEADASWEAVKSLQDQGVQAVRRGG